MIVDTDTTIPHEERRRTSGTTRRTVQGIREAIRLGGGSFAINCKPSAISGAMHGIRLWLEDDGWEIRVIKLAERGTRVVVRRR